jgi:glycosyltransferase involved in cell wall biosynthesis
LITGGFDASLSVTSIAPASVMQPLGGTVRATLDRNVAMRDGAAARWFKRATIRFNSKYQAAMRVEALVMRHPLVKRFAALSAFVARQLMDLYDVDPARITIIRNAVEMPEMDHARRAALRTAARQRLGIDDRTTVFLFAAFNPRLKGARTVERAMRRLRGEPIVTLMAGPAAGASSEAIRWLGPVEDMDELRAAADAVVMPTHYDPSSRVVIEAVRRGLAVIGSAYDGSTELLGGGAVVLADPADDRALAQAMRQLADPAERQRLVEIAAEVTAGGAFTMARHAGELEGLLLEVASEA